jgi:hypothetical protein
MRQLAVLKKKKKSERSDKQSKAVEVVQYQYLVEGNVSNKNFLDQTVKLRQAKINLGKEGESIAAFIATKNSREPRPVFSPPVERKDREKLDVKRRKIFS